jgi:hypothetical protein
LLHAFSNIFRDFHPVGAADDEGKADVENATSDCETKPEALYSHLGFEAKKKGKWHA